MSRSTCKRRASIASVAEVGRQAAPNSMTGPCGFEGSGESYVGTSRR